MTGICAFGLYLPMYRLPRDVIGQARGVRAPKAEKAVANYDEDAVTMAAEAALACVDNYGSAFGSAPDPGRLAALILATLPSPYQEKQSAPVLAGVLDASPSALVTDFRGSLWGGLTGMEVASQTLRNAPVGAKALVVASDKRPAEPGSAEEMAFGDGAAE